MKFAEYVTAQGKNYRFTHTNDLVPQVLILASANVYYRHIAPEYYITSQTNRPVRTSDVEVLEGIRFWPAGNMANVNINPFTENEALDAHGWYFGGIGKCLTATWEV